MAASPVSPLHFRSGRETCPRREGVFRNFSLLRRRSPARSSLDRRRPVRRWRVNADFGLAYRGGRLRVAGGRLVQYGDGGKVAGTALLEMYGGNDRPRAQSRHLGRDRGRLRGPSRVSAYRRVCRLRTVRGSGIPGNPPVRAAQRDGDGVQRPRPSQCNRSSRMEKGRDGARNTSAVISSSTPQ
jgi:hypothetical protein